MNKENKIEELCREIKSCKKCELWKTRTNALCGEGNLNPSVMFIAEAPGYNEDLQGKHFVGKAGMVFNRLLDSIALSRESIYITNIVKCKPNKKIKNEYIKNCTPYLDKQIEIIKPKIIVPLGKVSTAYILEKYRIKEQGIKETHGKIFVINNLLDQLKIIPQFHPAVAVYNPNMFDELEKDFKEIKV